MIPGQDAPHGEDRRASAPLKIFLSYRRSDAQASAGRLADDLRQYYGDSRVYRDVDSNRPAGDFVQHIQQALAASCIVIPIIGPRWLSATGPDQQRRLDNPSDWVRQELVQALASQVRILPVLVEGAEMPTADELPEPLQPLSRRQAHRMTDEQWPYDFGRLLEALADYGILPYGNPADADSGAEGPGLATQVKQALTTVRQYERTLQAPRRQAYMAVAGAVAMLRYSQIEEDLQAAQVRFTVYGRRITAKVVDAAPGYSSVIVEFASLRTGAAVAGALLTNVFGLAAGAGAIAFDRRFAKGFLDNVQGVLEGRGVGEDSALPPGLQGWRKKRRQV